MTKKKKPQLKQIRMAVTGYGGVTWNVTIDMLGDLDVAPVSAVPTSVEAKARPEMNRKDA